VKDFTGKVVLITDFDPELGPDAAERFLQAGASILVAGSQAKLVVANRFDDREGIIDTGVTELTAEKISELVSVVEQSYGQVDVIFMNNYVDGEFDQKLIFARSISMFTLLHKLHPLLRDGGTVVVCASFPLALRRKSRLVVGSAAAIIRSFAQSWARALEARRIRVNVVNLYKLDADDALDNEGFTLSLGRPAVKPSKPNTITEVVSMIVGLATDDKSASGFEVLLVNGDAQERRLTIPEESNELGTAAQIAENVIFLASDFSRPMTGMQLFPDGELRKL
jgi:NAD(P)-dependent dehydrogenase (short-subunit alcohol dehydrogenase family)